MGRPKGSKNRPKIERIEPVSPETAVAVYNVEHPNQHTEIINAPVFDQGKLQKRLNELVNH